MLVISGLLSWLDRERRQSPVASQGCYASTSPCPYCLCPFPPKHRHPPLRLAFKTQTSVRLAPLLVFWHRLWWPILLLSSPRLLYRCVRIKHLLRPAP